VSVHRKNLRREGGDVGRPPFRLEARKNCAWKKTKHSLSNIKRGLFENRARGLKKKGVAIKNTKHPRGLAQDDVREVAHMRRGRRKKNRKEGLQTCQEGKDRNTTASRKKQKTY